MLNSLKFTIFNILLLALCLNASSISRTQVIMGTYLTISLDAKDKKHIEKCFAIFKDVDIALSSFNKDATIYRLNKNRVVKLDRYSYEALALATLYYEKTDGYFDITVGSLTKDAYSFGDAQKIPSQKTIDSSKVDFKGFSYTKDRATLRDSIKLDFGGMGKGFGVDKIANYLSLHVANSNATISASGDIRCLGFCEIDIQNPFSNEPLLSFTTTKKNLGITTSGNYNRYVQTTKNNHLLNPKTKKPQTKFISITLISELPSSDLDAYATAVSVMPMKKAHKFLDSLDLAFVILQSDKKLLFSENISDYCKISKTISHNR